MTRDRLKLYIQNITYSAMFLAIGVVLPFFTGQIPRIGSMLLPMHIPVFLCGLICGWRSGGAVGFVLPVLRSALFGMPGMFPTAAAMAFELGAYGVISGVLYGRAKRQGAAALYRALLTAMVGGRLVWGTAMTLILGLSGSSFGWQLFLAGAFLNAAPGIVLQLVFIPAMMLVLDRTGTVRFRRD